MRGAWRGAAPVVGARLLGIGALLRGQAETAASLARESLVRKRAINNEQGIVWAIELLAWTAVACGDAHRAAVLFGAGEARGEDFGPASMGPLGCTSGTTSTRRAAGYARGECADALAQGRPAHAGGGGVMALGEGVAKPGETGDPVQALPLTRREHEIAGLVATGRQSRDRRRARDRVAHGRHARTAYSDQTRLHLAQPGRGADRLRRPPCRAAPGGVLSLGRLRHHSRCGRVTARSPML